MTPPRTMKLSGKLAERNKARKSAGVVLPAVKDRMLKDYEAGEDRRWDIIHPSALSHQSTFCPRATYLCITEGRAVSEKFDFVRENIFAEGNSIHAKWQARLRRSVPLWGNWKCIVCDNTLHGNHDPELEDRRCSNCECLCWEYDEITLDAEASHLLVGHADGGFGNTLVEFKSVGAGTVRIESPALYKRYAEGDNLDLAGLWRAIDRPFGTHLNQGDAYLGIAKLMGLPFDQVSYVYESKWNQMVKEFVIPYSQDRSDKLLAQATAIKYAVERSEEPECRFPGKCAECKPYDSRRAKATTKRTVAIRGDAPELDNFDGYGFASN